MKEVFALVAFLALFLGVLVLGARNYVMTTGACTLCKTMYTLLAPPGDYFLPLAEVETEAAELGSSVEIEFEPKYAGWHTISLSSRSVQLHFSTLSFIITCTDGSTELSNSATNKPSNLAVEEAGFELLAFRVPDHFSRGKKTSCAIDFPNGLRDFSTVSVRKNADI